MNPSTWQTIGVIAAIVLGIGGIYFSARSSSRESARMIAADKAKAVDDARAPLLIEIAQKNREIDRLNRTVDARDTRVNDLEDELRRGRGYGGDDRAGR
jgi:uncharacterized protein HemX